MKSAITEVYNDKRFTKVKSQEVLLVAKHKNADSDVYFLPFCVIKMVLCKSCYAEDVTNGLKGM